MCAPRRTVLRVGRLASIKHGLGRCGHACGRNAVIVMQTIGCRWNAGERVTAVAHDNPIPGFGTTNTINLRLWSAKPDKEFDLEAFNTGDYVQVGPQHR